MVRKKTDTIFLEQNVHVINNVVQRNKNVQEKQQMDFCGFSLTLRKGVTYGNKSYATWIFYVRNLR